MPKVSRKKSRKKAKRHDPLERQIAKSKMPGKLKEPKNQPLSQNVPEKDEEYLPERLSRKVLAQAQAQQKEEKDNSEWPTLGQAATMFAEEDSEEEDAALLAAEAEEVQEIDISEADELELSLFMPQSTASRRTLADIIMEKIQEKEEQKALQQSQQTEDDGPALDPKLVQVYTEVGNYLAQYTSGKIPKPFKIIPSLKNWEHMLYLTNPEKWTPNAMFYATKMFAANLNSKMAQRFYNLVLYPRIRDDIERNHRLNYHLYASLKRAIYKPSAFFRGIILPLAMEGCSAREAIIVSSVLQKISIPANHSAVALMKLASMEYSGPTVLFITSLLNKKYSLPHKVIDQLVNYFANFETDERRLPVVWHQAVLELVQRYKAQFTTLQKKRLKSVIREQVHNAITPEIRRELNSAQVLSSVAMEM